MCLSKLIEKRNKLQRKLEDFVNAGCGSASINHFEQKINQIEQNILWFHKYRCPHCGESLEEERVHEYQI